MKESDFRILFQEFVSAVGQKVALVPEKAEVGDIMLVKHGQRRFTILQRTTHPEAMLQWQRTFYHYDLSAEKWTPYLKMAIEAAKMAVRSKLAKMAAASIDLEA